MVQPNRWSSHPAHFARFCILNKTYSVRGEALLDIHILQTPAAKVFSREIDLSKP